MALNRISLASFRNHGGTRIEGTGHFNLLVGQNGAGKTNILEALSLFSPGRGLRRASLGEMARASPDEIASPGGKGGFGIAAELDCGDGREAVQLGTGTDPARPTRRIVQINGADSSAISLGEWLSVTWLTPAMDRLFTDSAGARRRYVDRLALALDPGHARHATRYENALRQRNRLLGDEHAPDPLWLDAIEAQLGEHGAALTQGRSQMIARLTQALAQLPEQPFARPALRLVAGGPQTSQALTRELRRTRGRDAAAQRTLTGPHRDELEVVMAGKGVAAANCSTGEQKAMLIAITLAHAELATGGRPGLLLLDEVAAHLDPLRRAALFDRLGHGKSQVWLTGTELAPFQEIVDQAACWAVRDGALEKL